MPSLLLSACPNLGSLTLDECSSEQWMDDPHTASTYTQLRILHLIDCETVWQLPHLPSLTALLLDGWRREAEEDEHTVNQVASQLTQLRLGHAFHLSPLVPHVPSLRHNLQRLELPEMMLTNDLYKSLHELLPGLRCVEFRELSLSSSHADVGCSWQELRLAPYGFHSLQQLAMLPLARAGRRTRGVQRLVLLPRIKCWNDSGDVGANVAAVCSSSCRLAPVLLRGPPPGAVLLSTAPQDLARVLLLLACFEPHSIRGLCLDVTGHMPQPGVAAVGAALAASGGGAGALARCHTLSLTWPNAFDPFTHNACFQDDAACAALLPMLMATPIVTMRFNGTMSTDQLAAICCPDSLAAVTRPIALHVYSMLVTPEDLPLVQAAIAAAGKADVVTLCWKPCYEL